MFTEMMMSASGGGEPVLLWTNQNASSAFSPQKVYLDLSSYSAVGIKYKETGNTMFIFKKAGIDTDTSWSSACGANYGSYGGSRVRVVKNITNTYVEFGNGWAHTIVDDTNMIPMYIYGIK